MRKLFTILVAVLLTASVFAQSPEKMSYQAVIRDASDNLITDTQIGMQISILQGSVSSSAVYVETQEPSTNANGLVSIEIGTGTVESGDFTAIDWSNGLYFIKTETDPDGATDGIDYTITGTSQLLSVPYALHAKTTESVPTGTQTGEMQYWNGSEWISVAAGTTGQRFTNINGVPTWIDGDAQVDPVSGQIWKDVTSPTGETWMDRNLGATQVATSSTDADAYGDLYQWGRAADGHQSRTSDTASTLSNTDTPGHGDFIISGSIPYDWRNPQNDTLWQGASGTNNPCPSGYRLPTEAEWEAEIATWDSEDAAGAFASPLKLPVAGYREGSDGSLTYVSSHGDYWSSTVGGKESRSLYFHSSSAGMLSSYRAVGNSVRCLKD